VAQLPAVHILTRVHNRRVVVVVAALASRLLLVLIALLVFTGSLTSGGLVAIMAASAVLAVVATAAWNTWMREALDPGRFGRFFAFRLQIATVIGAFALLAGGWFLHVWAKRGMPSDGYAILYLGGAAAGLASALVLSRTPNPPPVMADEGHRRSATLLILETLQTPGSGSTVLGLGLAATAMSVALPFTAVYLLRSLGYSVLAVTFLALASQLAYVVGLRVWGRVSDKYGNRPVMQIAAGMLTASLLLWSFAWRGSPGLFAYLATTHVLSGLAIGGLELTTGNLLLKTAPRHKVAPHLAAFSLMRAAIAGVATVLAGLLWEILGRGPLATWSVAGVTVEFRGFHVLALLSAAAALLATRILGRIPEPEAGKVPEVARAMRREVQILSSVAGIRAFTHVSSFLAEALRRPRRPRKTQTLKHPGGSGP
ncbi:MAG TPA: MFS transporter, partial [Candidatus Thermoplasmatota archaeon]|nr:MFS transporter [Candidatus Thermoplasmatota archaeon]